MSVKKRIAGLKTKLQDWRTKEDNCLNLCKTLLFYMGLWPGRKEHPGLGRIFRRWLPRAVFAMINYANLIGHPVITYQSIGLEDIGPFLESVANTFAAVLLYLHIYCLLFQRDRLHKVFKAFHAMRRKGRRLPYRPVAILLRNKKMADFVLASMFLVFAVTGVVGMILMLKLHASRNYAFHEWYPIDKYKTPAFEILFTINFLRLAYLVFMAISFYIIQWTLLVETIGQYRLLSYNLGNLPSNSRNEDDDSSPGIANRSATVGPDVDGLGLLLEEQGRKMREEDVQEVAATSRDKKAVRRDSELEALKKCVRHHHAIVGFVHEFQSAFDLILFCHLACTMAPTALGIALIFFSEALQDKAIMAIGIVIGCYALLGAMCFVADEINAQDEAIREAVYGCNWLRASDGFKRSLRIIMSRSNQPLVVKLAGFIPLNMATFYETVKMTYTYTMAVVTHYQQHTD